MKSRPARLAAEATLVAIDAALVWVSLAAAYWIRFISGRLSAPKGTPPFEDYLPGTLVACALFFLAFRAHDLHRPRRALSAIDEAATVLRAVLVGSLLTMAAAFLYRGVSYSRFYFVIFWGVASVLLPAGRLVFRIAQRALHERGVGLARIAIVGTGEMGSLVARRIAAHPALGYEVVGFVAAAEGDSADPAGPPPAPTLGFLADIAAIVERESLDRILVALPLSEHHRMLDVVAACDRLPVEILFVPDLLEIMTQKVRVSEIDGMPLLAIRAYPLEAWNRVVKRAFDIALLATLLVLFAPLSAAAAVLARLDSPGPSLFRQRRIGRDGREFTILKFRTMPVNAESATGPVISDADDPRATRLGRLLRRACIDELPQLWNVLVGEMSLVGPRPERPVFVDQFDREVPRYFARHRVKSGVTGWAQVNGLRGTTSIEERTKYDVFYVENWSLFFDLKILFLTARQVLFANRPRSEA